MFFKTDFSKKYALLCVAFICSLCIPFLLLSFHLKNSYSSSLLRETRQYNYPPLVKYSYRWPDISSFTNGFQPKNESNSDIYREIDQAYCGQDRCKFILPIVITEQESKAQLHFRQLAFLAGKLGRTIVLPNVYNSHMGSCLAQPFQFYYDLGWLDDNSSYFSYITMDDFKAWILARHYAGAVPSGQEIYMQGTRNSRLLKKVKNCFQDSFDFSGRPSVSYQFADHQDQRHINVTNLMMNLLSDEAREHEYLDNANNFIMTDEDSGSNGARNRARMSSPPVDVLNLFYDRRYKFIKDRRAQEPLSYNQRWVDMANNIASQLTPYMAIHWRMERLEPVSNLVPCAMGLIDRVHQLETTPNVFLLTDYPHLLNTTGAKPESSSFHPRQLRPEHHEAIQYLYQHLNVSLTSVGNNDIPYDELPKENWHILPIDVSNHDSLPPDRSVLGIVDKLVAMNAQWFFAGRPGVCAKSSSFTGLISNRRAAVFKNGDSNMVSPLQTFNIKKDVILA